MNKTNIYYIGENSNGNFIVSRENDNGGYAYYKMDMYSQNDILIEKLPNVFEYMRGNFNALNRVSKQSKLYAILLKHFDDFVSNNNDVKKM